MRDGSRTLHSYIKVAFAERFPFWVVSKTHYVHIRTHYVCIRMHYVRITTHYVASTT